MKLSLDTSFETVRNDPDFFLNLYREGLLEMRRTKPQASEIALTSTRHEIHVVAEGSARLLCDGRTERARRGDVLYIDAGSQYRFSNLTQDFATWVFFSADGQSPVEDPFEYLQAV